MYNIYLETYFNNSMALSGNKKKLGNKYDSVNLFFKTYNYEDWFKIEESADTIRKSDKKICRFIWHSTISKWWKSKSRKKKLKILIPNKLTKLAMLLTQRRAGNNSHKLKKWNQTDTISFVSA